MNDLRDDLLEQAETAFLSIAEQVNFLLDATHIYTRRNPMVTAMDKVKYRELKQAVFDLGTIPKMLASEIARWKKGEERVLSRQGIEANLLNELYATMEPLLWFFTREKIEVPGFSLDLVQSSYYELIRCNRLL